ncbi:MAG: carbohydrate-binding family 9-like protein [Gracilimonas sp.]
MFTFIVILNPKNIMAQAEILVKKTKDIIITGSGSAQNWNRTSWSELTEFSGLADNEVKRNLATKFKVLYSDDGIYFLFHCEDEKLSATMQSNFMELWREDVVEVFLWSNENELTYFEYELSPLNYELPLLVTSYKNKQSHWVPFEFSYKEGRRTIHKTSVKGGKKESGARITEWTAEFFIPFELLRPMDNIFPVSGTKWRANLYRIDYDRGVAHWGWQAINENFHDYENFGIFIFE